MSNEKLNQAAIDEAKKIISDIVTSQKSTDNKNSQISKKIEGLEKAQRLIEESVYRVGMDAGKDDSGFSDFIRDDGSIRMTSEKSMLDTPNGRRPIQKQGLLDVEQGNNEWHQKTLSLWSERSLARLLMRNPHTPKSDLELQKHFALAPKAIRAPLQKAMFDSAGVGGEWVPDEFSSTLFESYKTPNTVRSLFQETTMDSNVLLVPRLDRGGRPYLKGQVTSNNPTEYTASNIQSSQKQITMAGMATRYVIDDALAEDAAIALIPTLQRQITRDLADAMEDALINGDATATHQDDIAKWNIRSRWGASGLGGSSDHRRAFTGLRAQAFDRSSTLDTNSFDVAKFLELQNTLGELGTSDLVLIVSPEVLINHFLSLTQVLTIDKFGPSATILNGQLGSLFDIPIIQSRYMGADMAATGLFVDPVPTPSFSGMLLVSRSSYQMYSRRGIMVEQDKNINSGAINLVATQRATFDTLDPNATKNVAYGFNMSV